MSIHALSTSTTFEFKGKKLTALIDVFYTHEIEPELTGSEEFISAYRAGEQYCLRVEVEARFHGFIAHDVSRQVIVSNVNPEAQVLAKVEEHNMIERALDNLRERIKETLRALEGVA